MRPRALSRPDARHEMAHEIRDIVAAVAQRRHEDRKNVEAVEQVFAEFAVLHLLQQVTVRCRDQTDVDLDGRARADRIDLAVLDRAQKLHLHFERQVADLVEEKRAGMRFDELARMLFGRAGKRTLLVAEQDAIRPDFPELRRN